MLRHQASPNCSCYNYSRDGRPPSRLKQGRTTGNQKFPVCARENPQGNAHFLIGFEKHTGKYQNSQGNSSFLCGLDKTHNELDKTHSEIDIAHGEISHSPMG